MWDSMSVPWKAAFEEAWNSYIKGSLPIGAVVADQNGTILSRGRNRIEEDEAPEKQIYKTDLAHAELNALIQISKRDYGVVRDFILYTTLEPCPLCFGALYVSGIKNLKYAAGDCVGGSVNLLGKTEYLSKKQINIEGPFDVLQELSIALMALYLFERGKSSESKPIINLTRDSFKGVQIAEKWAETGIIQKIKTAKLCDVINELVGEFRGVA